MKRSRIEIMADFMTGLNTMTDAAGQMIHQQANMKFMAIRDMLHLVRDAIEKQNPGMGSKN